MNYKKITLSALALAIVGTVLATGTVSAHFSEERLQKIAERTGKSVEEIQANFEERKANREARMLERLDEAVTNGTITEAQKQLLLEKHEERKAEHEAMHESGETMTREERRAHRQEKRAEFQAWAEANGIDLEALRGDKPEGRRGMHKGGFAN